MLSAPPSDAWPAPQRAAYRISPGRPGRTILLLHGLGGNLDQLQGTILTREHQPATILAVDARLHGQTGNVPQTPLTFDLLANDAYNVLRALRPQDTYAIVGVSMGAGVALRMLQRWPESFDRAVLIRPAWLHHKFPDNLAVLGEIGRLLRDHGRDEGRRAYESSAAYRDVRVDSPSTAASALAQFDDNLAEERCRRLLEMPASVPYDSPSDLKEIEQPVLVIAAPNDPVHPVGIAEAWAAGLPRSIFAVVPGRDVDPSMYQNGLRRLVDSFVTESKSLWSTID